MHTQDICRPLAITRDVPAERAAVVLDFLVSPKATRGFVSEGLVDGLALATTDNGWHHGTGADVTGPAASMMSAISGRGSALDELSGDGVDTLRTRLDV